MKWAPAFAGRQTRGGGHIAHYEKNETYFVDSGRLGTAGIVTDYTGAVTRDELHYPWGQEWTGAVGATLMYFGGFTATSQAVGAAMETYVPGSVEATTEFISGMVTPVA
ncbi:MAG: hypothetical protein KGM47_07940 [Acidobacteriota bacterium]|nr:hypothetical protein [Acidobacteriota bacterium]